MARGVKNAPLLPAMSLVLDAHAFGLYVVRDRTMRSIVAAAEADGYSPVLSVVTLVEQHQSAAGADFTWAVSQTTVIDATRAVADRAAELLAYAGLDGHKNVVDAFVVATASFASAGAKVASSDGTHIPPLCRAASAITRTRIEPVAV